MDFHESLNILLNRNPILTVVCISVGACLFGIGIQRLVARKEGEDFKWRVTARDVMTGLVVMVVILFVAGVGLVCLLTSVR
jgi:hypothetical protein